MTVVSTRKAAVLHHHYYCPLMELSRANLSYLDLPVALFAAVDVGPFDYRPFSILATLFLDGNFGKGGCFKRIDDAGLQKPTRNSIYYLTRTT